VTFDQPPPVFHGNEGRTVRLQRTLAASPTRLWRYWTDAELIRCWWSPEHFSVVECDATRSWNRNRSSYGGSRFRQ
jgi:uncharacterized protein YndB with AHSA1/START domain